MANTAIFVVLWLGAKFDLVNPSPSRRRMDVWEGEDPRMAACYGASCCEGKYDCHTKKLPCSCSEHLHCKVSKVKEYYNGEPYDKSFGKCDVEETKLELIRKSFEKCSGDKCTGYRGTRDKTLTGRICKPWSTVDTLTRIILGRFVDNGLVENYCRNPKKLREDIWCYTGLKEKEWEYCSLGNDCTSTCVYGTCTPNICKCEPGYGGENCDKNVDECQSNPCVHGSCIDGINDYTCKCQEYYTGKNCEQEIFLKCPPIYTGHDCNHRVGRRYGCWVSKCWRSTDDQKSWCWSSGSSWSGVDYCTGNTCKAAALRPCA